MPAVQQAIVLLVSAEFNLRQGQSQMLENPGLHLQ